MWQQIYFSEMSHPLHTQRFSSVPKLVIIILFLFIPQINLTYYFGPLGKSVKIWRSEHRNCMEDRIHYFECGYGPVHYTEANCAWTQNYVNVLDHPLVYKCPHNGFITGIKSQHGGGTNDRK